MKLSSQTYLIKLVLFSLYPFLSIFFMLLGLGSFWGPIVVVIAAGIMFFTYFLMLVTVSQNTAGRASSYVFVFFAFGFSLLIHPKGLIFAIPGLFLFFIVFGFIMYLLKRTIGDFPKRLFDPDNRAALMGKWFVNVLASSIPASTGLARLENSINIIPIFVIALIFGWLGPEVTYKIVNSGEYRYVKATALELVFFLTIVFFYMILETNPVWEPLLSDAGIVNVLTIISVPSMLISRITFESFKSA